MRNKYGSTPLDEIHQRDRPQVELRVQQMQAVSTVNYPKLFQEAIKAGLVEREVMPPAQLFRIGYLPDREKIGKFL